MDIEQLKLITELLRDTKDSAVWVACLFAAAPLLETLIGGLTFVLCLSIVGRIIIRLVKSFSVCASGWAHVARAVGLPGDAEEPSPRGVDRVLEAVRSLKALETQ